MDGAPARTPHRVCNVVALVDLCDERGPVSCCIWDMSSRGACLLVPPDVPLPHSFKMEVDQTWRVAQRGMAALVACRRAIPEITGKKSAGSRSKEKAGNPPGFFFANNPCTSVQGMNRRVPPSLASPAALPRQASLPEPPSPVPAWT
jgi:hypothetical protein